MSGNHESPAPDSLAAFPYLGPQAEHAPGHHTNLEFTGAILKGFNTLDRTDPNHSIAVEATTRCLDEVDRLYGTGVENLGDGYHTDPWAEKSLPAFYHNGLRTKVAIADTVAYMHWANAQAESASEIPPYSDPLVIYGTILAAAFDDLVFTGERVVDEDASRAVAREYLETAGASRTIIEAVDVAINASKFNESTGQQAFDPTQGAVAEQVGSLVGDLWGLGTPQGAANTFMLAVENMWKAGPPINKDGGRILYDIAVSSGWRGKNIFDFFDLVQANPAAKEKFATFLDTNRGFIVGHHRYPDPRINELLAAGKTQSATLQEHLGKAIKDDRLTIRQAFRCALIYAHTRVGWEQQISLLVPYPITPNDIAKIVLTRNSAQELANPVPATAFFHRYMAELGQ